MLKRNKTYLSPKVQKFLALCVNGDVNEFDKIKLYSSCNTNEKTTITNVTLVNDDLTLNWEDIHVIFEECNDLSFDIHNQNEEWYLHQALKIQPILFQAKKRLIRLTDRNHQCFKMCEWTFKTNQIKQALFEANKYTRDLEGVLTLTSVLERALGNVFKLNTNDAVPFLLRDLLGSREVISVLGKLPVIFAQFLIGTPKALNLRNLVWHGFVTNSELDYSFVAILMSLIVSFGLILDQNNLKTRLKQRNAAMVSKYDSYFTEVSSKLQFKNDNFFQIIDSNSGELFLKNWNEIIQMYKNKRYGPCLTVMLPEFECFMRVVYCMVMERPQRLLTAESSEYYTTLDTIFEQKNGNKIFELFPKYLIDMYHDIFVFLHGPRLRDKISHGEFNMEEIDEKMCRCSLHLILSFVWHRGGLGLGVDNQLSEEVNYRIKFHANAILMEKFCVCIGKLQKVLIESHNSHGSSIFNNFDWKLLNNFNGDLNVDLVKKLPIPAYFREKTEAKYVNILTKIVDNVTSGLNNCLCKLKETRGLHPEESTLRSRKREQIFEFPQIIFDLSHRVQLLFVSVLDQVYKLFCKNECEEDTKRLKYLQKLQQMAEKFNVDTSPNRNQFKNVVKRMNDLEKILLLYYLTDFKSRS